MANRISVTNSKLETLVIDLRSPEESGLYVKNIDGLGPVKSDISTTSLVTTDGVLFNNARVGSRVISLSLGFMQTDDESVEEVRLKTYRYFPVKQAIRFTVETNSRTVYIDGYVETNQPDIFSAESGCEISIVCPNPYFIDANLMTTVFTGTLANFEFPFSNESLSDPMIEFGLIEVNNQKTIEYLGEQNTGVVINIHLTGPVTELTIYDLTSETKMGIVDLMLDVEGLELGSLQAGDDIIITTVVGSKSIVLIRGGVTYNILVALDPDSTWFVLTNGDNDFLYTAATGASEVTFSVENNVLYQGV